MATSGIDAGGCRNNNTTQHGRFAQAGRVGRPTTNERKREAMTVHADLSNHEQLHATATELQTMTELIGKYPAEAQLIMAALEDGLTLGPMRVP
jgi:hypothetical protein